MALLLSGQQQIAAAVRHLKEAVRIQPAYAEARYQLGKIYAQQNRTKEAVHELEKAIECSPDHDGAYNALARIYLKQGNKEQAEQLLATLIERKQKRKAAIEKKVSGNE